MEKAVIYNAPRVRLSEMRTLEQRAPILIFKGVEGFNQVVIWGKSFQVEEKALKVRILSMF